MELMQLLFSFRGRIGRKTYWTYILWALALVMLLSFATLPFGEDVEVAAHAALLTALLWPGLAMQAKRWHDRNKSAWWLAINLIPYVGVLWSLVECGILRGTPGANRFGPDPLPAAKE